MSAILTKIGRKMFMPCVFTSVLAGGLSTMGITHKLASRNETSEVKVDMLTDIAAKNPKTLGAIFALGLTGAVVSRKDYFQGLKDKNLEYAMQSIDCLYRELNSEEGANDEYLVDLYDYYDNHIREAGVSDISAKRKALDIFWNAIKERTLSQQSADELKTLTTKSTAKLN